jgi:hypothetical protein
MINIWVKFLSDQFELGLKLSRAFWGLGSCETPVSAGQAKAAAPGHFEGPVAAPVDEHVKETVSSEVLSGTVAPGPGIDSFAEGLNISDSSVQEAAAPRIAGETGKAQARASAIGGIMSFLESTSLGATAKEIAEHLEITKKSVLPLLKTLVKEGKIEELLGKYCLLKQ